MMHITLVLLSSLYVFLRGGAPHGRIFKNLGCIFVPMCYTLGIYFNLFFRKIIFGCLGSGLDASVCTGAFLMPKSVLCLFYRHRRGKVVFMKNWIIDFLGTSEGMAVYFIATIIIACIAMLLIESIERRIKKKIRHMKYRAGKILPAYQLCRAQMRQLKRKRRSLASHGIRLILSLLRG